MRVCTTVALVALSAFPATAGAQQAACSDAVTVADCVRYFETLADAARTARSGRAIAARSAAHTTGLGVGPTASSISDFLALFSTVLSGNGKNAASDIAMNFTFPVDLDPAEPGAQRVRGQVIRHKAVIYQPLLDALPDSVRTVRAADLTSQLHDFGDVEAHLAWNLETGTFGRGFSQQRALWDSFFLNITGAAERSAGQRHAAAVSVLLNGVTSSDLVATQGCSLGDFGDARSAKLACLTPGYRKKMVSGIRQAVAGEAQIDSVVNSALKNTGFYRFADLVSNQPQLSVELHGRFRQTLVGPNSWGGTIRFEMGFANVNRFKKYCKRQNRKPNAGCLTDYLAIPGVASAIKAGNRVWLSADFERTNAYADTLAADAVAVTTPGSEALTIAGGLGRYVGSIGDAEAGRVDLEGQYVFRRDDPTRENRFLISLTYSQRLTDGSTLVLGLQYANKPEYLGAVSDKLSANFGIRYNVLPAASAK